MLGVDVQAEAADRGLTLVLVTHDASIARQAQRVGVMSNGHLTIRQDSPNR